LVNIYRRFEGTCCIHVLRGNFLTAHLVTAGVCHRPSRLQRLNHECRRAFYSLLTWLVCLLPILYDLHANGRPYLPCPKFLSSV
jgi:hypothetical protein